MLDEKALRKPGFAEGVPVRLCDGQLWTLPTPVLSGFTFTQGQDGSTRLARATAFGDTYDALVDRYVEADTGTGEAVALFDLAYHLLSLNYDLTFRQAGTLLRLVLPDSPDAAASDAMWGEVAAAAMGTARPKVTPVGGTPS